MMTNDGTHGIVRVVFLYELAQDLAGSGPVPARGRHKGGVERFGRSGHARVRGHDGKVGFGLVDLSGLEVHPLPSADRSSPLVLLVVAVVDEDSFCW